MQTRPFTAVTLRNTTLPLLFLGLAIVQLPAADRSWNGLGTNNYWTTSSNWNATVAAGDSLFFGGTTRLTPSNDFPAGTVFSNLTFNSGGGAFVLLGNPISLSGNITNNQVTSTVRIGFDLVPTSTAFITVTSNGGNNGVLSITGAVSGPFGLIKSGLGNLNLGGANTFNGDLIVQQGILGVDHNSALGSTNGVTTINSGASLGVGAASLGVNGLDLGEEQIFVAGSGVGGQGAIRSNNSDAQQNALQRVTLTGDTTFGGSGPWTTSGGNPGRWDIRGTPSTAFINVVGGQPYNLTKTGSNEVRLAGITVDSALGNIDILQGALGIEGNTTSLGNTNNTLTVYPGATFELVSATNRVNKKIVLIGDGVTQSVDNRSGSNTLLGPITLSNECVFLVRGGGTALTNRGPLSGSGGLTKTGGATPTSFLVLTATNTYTGNTLVSVGTLVLSGTGSISNSAFITVVSNATLDASARTDRTLAINSNQTLNGEGLIRGRLVISPGGTISPGTSANPLGFINIESNADFSGIVQMEINRTNTRNCDFINIESNGPPSINYGGTLTVSNLGPALQLGDSFTLFGATNYTGSFSVIYLPPLPGGLAWNTSGLATSGTISVVAGGNKTWVGLGTNNNWSTSSNWNSVVVAGDSLFFDGSTRLTPSNDFPAGTTFSNITFNSGAGAFTLLGNPIALAGNITNNQNQVGNPMKIGFDLNPTSTAFITVTSNGGNSASLTLTGTVSGAFGLIKAGGGVLTLAGANTFSGSATVAQGTLALSGTGSISNSAFITVVSNATLDASARTDRTLVINNNQTLNGEGLIRGRLVVSAGGTISPGTGANPLGFINIESNADFSGIVQMEINRTNSRNCDFITVVSNGPPSITYGGTLTVSNLGPALQAGDSFKLFSASNYTGSFSSIYVPTGDDLLTWNTSALATSGTISVVPSGNKLWSGLGTNDLWTTSSNWNAAIDPGDSLFFDGSNRLTPSNDFPAGTTFSNITFNSGAGAFTLLGNSIVLAGNITNNQVTNPMKIGFDLNPTSTAFITVTSNGGNSASLTLTGAVSGPFGLTKTGAGLLTLGGSNTFTGTVTVAQGTLRVDNNSALGATNGATTVNSGATLDVGAASLGANGLDLGNEMISVAGSGVNGQGAIVGTFSDAQQNALKRVTLTGDTTFGGSGPWTTSGTNPGRWDIRGTPSTASLSTGGQPYKLTKTGSNEVRFAGLTLDLVFTDIDLQQGALGIEGNTTSLGNTNNTLTVYPGATFELISATNRVNKKIVLIGDGVTQSVDNRAGNNTILGPITLSNECVFLVRGGGTALTNRGPLSGSGGLNKTGGTTPTSSLLVLTATNTYTGDTVVSAGTLVLSGTGSISNSAFITVVSNATLDASARTDRTLVINNNQTLNGEGLIRGRLAISPGGTISPGTSANPLGFINVESNADFSGIVQMEINRTNARNCDFITVVSNGPPSITYGGTLTVTNLGPPLQAGDSFTLFAATIYTGAFGVIYLPPMPGGLAWDTSGLATNGSIRVVALPPTNISYTINLPGGGNGNFYLIANQLDHGSNTLDEILPNMPDGTQIFTWDCTIQDFSAVTPTYSSFTHHWTPNSVLAPGQGAFIVPGGALASITFTGTPHVPVLPATLPCGYGSPTILSRQTNGLGTFENITGRTPTEGARVYTWNVGVQDYVAHDFSCGAWTPSVPSVGIGEAALITVADPSAGSPVIQTDVSSKTVCNLTTVSFSVTVCGTAPLSYQWQKDSIAIVDGGNVSGSHTATLTILNADLADAGAYQVVVSNAFGTTASSTANLAVNDCGAVIYEGLVHRPLGQAILDLDMPSNQLTIGNLGSSGQDGVDIALPPGNDFAGFWLPLDPGNALPVGAYVQSQMIGTAGSVSNGVLGTTRCTKAGTSNYVISVDYLPVGSFNRTVQIYNGSVLVAQLTGQTGAACATVKLPPGSCTINPWLNNEWPSPTLITISGGPAVMGTEIVMIPEGAAAVSAITTERILAANVPSITMTNETLSVIYGGLTLSALGNAFISVESNAPPAISNLGTNGADGVSFALPVNAPALDVHWQALNPSSPVGAYIQERLIGTANGVTNGMLGTITMTKVGNTNYVISADYTPIGVSNLVLKAFRNGLLVAQTTNQTSAALASGNIWGDSGCIPLPPIIGGGWDWTNVLMNIVGGPSVQCDHLYIMPQNVFGTPTALEITASQVPFLNLTAITASPLVIRGIPTPAGLTLQWFGTGRPQQSSDLKTWTDITNAVSPLVVPLGLTKQFYRIATQ